jgi:hypothetical protein
VKGPNLFTRLAAYSQNPKKLSIENYCTELLAHCFNNDLVFRRRFLNVIFGDWRMARPFKKSIASTQEALGHDCRVDLVLRTGSRVHLIEVKLSAGETRSGRWGQIGKPQVQRYLDLRQGHVTFLTTSASLPPDTDHRGRTYRMVKHALFEELHQALASSHVSELTKLFLNFMEENGMAGPQPFDRRELRRAGEAFEIFKKCQSTLAIVRTEANGPFRNNLRTRSNLTRPAFKSGPDWGYMDSYLAKFHKRAVRWVGMILQEGDAGTLDFTVYAHGTLHPSIGRIRRHLGWENWDNEHWCCSSIRLRGSAGDIPRMVEHAKTASKELGRAIRRFA